MGLSFVRFLSRKSIGPVLWVLLRLLLRVVVLGIGAIGLLAIDAIVLHPCSFGRYGQWSAGVTISSSPLDFTPSPTPTLSCLDVSDCAGTFVADPFLFKPSRDYLSKIDNDYTSEEGEGEKEEKKNGKDKTRSELIADAKRIPHSRWFLFFEVMNEKSNSGDIGVAFCDDPLGPRPQWIYQQIVLRESFHLSYPFVFEHEGEVFMIPETNEANAVRLYRAESFPTKWTFVKELLSNDAFIDSSLLFHGGLWYLWTNKLPAKLELYISSSLNEPFQPHPASPIYQNNPRLARPGGRPFLWNGTIVRLAQDCTSLYGEKIVPIVVSSLTSQHYQEAPLEEIAPIADFPWISQRTHHLDPHFVRRAEMKNIENDDQRGEELHGDAGDGEGVWLISFDGNSTRHRDFTVFVWSVILLVAIFVLLDCLVLGRGFYSGCLRIAAILLQKSGGNNSNNSNSRGVALYSLLSGNLKEREEDDDEDGGKSESATATTTVENIPGHHQPGWTGLLFGNNSNSNSNNSFGPFSANVVFRFALVALVIAMMASAMIMQSYSESVSALTVRPTHRLSPSSPSSSALAPTFSTWIHDSKMDRKCEITLVTAMFDIGRESAGGETRKWSTYKFYFQQVLEMDSCMIIRCDPRDVEWVQSVRKGMEAQTQIMSERISNMTDYEHYATMKDIIDHPSADFLKVRPGRPEKKIVAYNVIMFKKIDWVMEAVDTNPFNSSIFFWIDAGYGHGMYMAPYKNKQWPNPKKLEHWLPRNQMIQVKVGSYDREECDDINHFIVNHRIIFAGGFFGGYEEPIRQAHALYHQVLDDHMSKRMMDDDQTPWLDVYCRAPTLVRPIVCPTPLVPFGLYCHVVGQQPCMTHRRYNCPAYLFAPE